MKDYRTPVNIPEGQSGRIKIARFREPASHVFQLATSRTAIIGGDRGKPVSWPHETTWHELSEEGRGCWMTDLPIEQHQMHRQTTGIRSGRVLVGGLGLGVVAAHLSRKPKIESITVVELSPDVISLVAPHLHLPKVEYVNADLLEYLKGNPGRFDHAFYDTWQSDGETTFFNIVVPLLQASNGVVRRRPVCWNENVMRGQLYMGLRCALEMTRREMPKQDFTREQFAQPKGNVWWDWKVPFWRWVNRVKGPESYLMEGMKAYVASYGTPDCAQLFP